MERLIRDDRRKNRYCAESSRNRIVECMMHYGENDVFSGDSRSNLRNVLDIALKAAEKKYGII